jgi:hypothetical protein
MNDDSGICEPEPDDCDDGDDGDEPLDFDKFVRICPNCKQQITQDMDSCPFCGDIIFRHLSDGVFTPRKGLWTKVFTIIIILLVTLAVLGILIPYIR